MAFLSIFSLNAISLIAAIVLSISHAFSSCGLFLFIGSMISIVQTRSIDVLTYMSSSLRLLMFALVLCNISMPGTLNFIAELLCIISFISINYILCLLSILPIFMTTYLWWLLYNRKRCYASELYNLDIRSNMLVLLLIIVNVISGLWCLF
jgi:NADH:ubiquinone oxidoreductase subunit 4 (subunit M)